MAGTYDLVVVGGGTAGIIAARTAGRLGARVVLVERDRLGGDCLWTGCVPSKSLIAAGRTAHTMRASGPYGITPVRPRVDFTAVLAQVRRAIARIEPADSPLALTETGAEVLFGTAVFTGPGEVRVDGVPLRFRRAVVATGSSPTLPPVPGLREVDPLTSDSVWDLEELPAHLVVLGGGPIGCELGQAFARLGAEVTVIEATDRVVPNEEPAASSALAAALAAEGVRVRTATTVTAATRSAGAAGVELTVTGAGGTTVVRADRILVATGRRPRTTELGLADAGVRLDDQGRVVVDATLRTTNHRIYAAGDIAATPTGTLLFTHVAGMHGSIAATNAVLARTRRIDQDRIPRVTFTDPEIAHVGLTESRARQQYGDVRVRLVGHEHLDRAIVEEDTRGFTQVVLDDKGRVLGATIVAPRAGEMIAELTAVIARRGRLRDLASVVHAYPTWGGAVWQAAVAEADAALRTPRMRRVVRALLALRRMS
ncbi:dihydrolipoyl dehydrogenase family protein [Actinophytocola sp.]|uniref:dihydrolipoyl dehydrogenase family protein n=1 Tax=Actinophytocola sp. TaxID=1872138 RepID=UPI002EDA9BE4